jgi:hypothetical protein
MADGGWTVELHRDAPGVEDTAELLTARGAAVRWCGPECACERNPAMSVTDPGDDLAPAPPAVPPAETRGGEDIEWDKAKPGEPLPEKDIYEWVDREKYDWQGQPRPAKDRQD